MQYRTGAYYLRLLARLVRRCSEAVAVVLDEEAEDLHAKGWPDAQACGRNLKEDSIPK